MLALELCRKTTGRQCGSSDRGLGIPLTLNLLCDYGPLTLVHVKDGDTYKPFTALCPLPGLLTEAQTSS